MEERRVGGLGIRRFEELSSLIDGIDWLLSLGFYACAAMRGFFTVVVVLACWQTLEVEFDNGERFIYSAEFLRVKSPAADSQRRSARGTARGFVFELSAEIGVSVVELV